MLVLQACCRHHWTSWNIRFVHKPAAMMNSPSWPLPADASGRCTWTSWAWRTSHYIQKIFVHHIIPCIISYHMYIYIYVCIYIYIYAEPAFVCNIFGNLFQRCPFGFKPWSQGTEPSEFGSSIHLSATDGSGPNALWFNLSGKKKKKLRWQLVVALKLHRSKRSSDFQGIPWQISHQVKVIQKISQGSFNVFLRQVLLHRFNLLPQVHLLRSSRCSYKNGLQNVGKNDPEIGLSLEFTQKLGIGRSVAEGRWKLSAWRWSDGEANTGNKTCLWNLDLWGRM